MQFIEILFFLQERGLSYAISGISFSSPKMWTIICNFLNFFPFSKNVDYHMQFMKFVSLLQNWAYHMQFLEFLSLFQKRRLSYAIYEIFFSSPKMWTIICNFYNFFLFPENVDYHMQFMKVFSI